ncbi:MAG: cupin domain-containing protein [Bradymonadia bacterium]
MSKRFNPVVNVDDIQEEFSDGGGCFKHGYRVLTPQMGYERTNLNLSRLPPKCVAVPFHAHQRDDEIFYILSGRGVLRYGDEIHPLRPGDCVSCPAGSGIAHQVGNPYDEDLIYLAIGGNDPDEVVQLPDSGKIMIRSLKAIGELTPRGRSEGEPDWPRVFEMFAQQKDTVEKLT